MSKKTKTAKKTTKTQKTPAATCCLCGAELKGHGNNPVPLAAEGKCCDKCNAEKVLPARAAELGARRAKAAEYYKANADKLREASRKSHARRREAVRAASEAVAAVFDALQGVVSERGAEFFDAFYKKGGEAMMNDFEDAVNVLSGKAARNA